jgi:starvation-inducible DNA-binding protein
MTTTDGKVEPPPSSQPRLHQHGREILIHAHAAAARAAETGDDGTNDMLVSQVVRTGELQAWFLSEHLVDTPLVRA